MTSRQAAIQVKKQRPDYDRHAYTRGWRSWLYATGDGFPMQAADARGEPKEWYDGYTDASFERDKWHIPLCENHHNGEGGCGQC